MADTVGFAQNDRQMDGVMELISSLQADELEEAWKVSGMNGNEAWKAAICPHDDYAYAGYLYPAILRNIRAKTVILVGVAHKARLLNLEDRIVFGSYAFWHGPYGPVKVSNLREEIIEGLPHEMFQVNDSMMRMEHSLEALVPFLQYYNREVEILPILVPYMSFERMKSIAQALAETVYEVTMEKNLHWGRDFAILISNDAVHYGDEDWGGKNLARFGSDTNGYIAAKEFEKEVVATLTGNLTIDNLAAFCGHTVQENDFKEYKWTWCGRYSVPFGLLSAYYLNDIRSNSPVTGTFVGYRTSIDLPPLPVENLGMGVTAPANLRHWVGYAAVGYK